MIFFKSAKSAKSVDGSFLLCWISSAILMKQNHPQIEATSQRRDFMIFFKSAKSADGSFLFCWISSAIL